jgi:hypothetical protein
MHRPLSPRHRPLHRLHHDHSVACIDLSVPCDDHCRLHRTSCSFTNNSVHARHLCLSADLHIPQQHQHLLLCIDTFPYRLLHGQHCPCHMYLMHTTGCAVQSWHSLLSQASVTPLGPLCDCCVPALGSVRSSASSACASREGLGHLLLTTNSAHQAF